MSHPQKVREPPGKKSQRHDNPVLGQGDGFPKAQEITYPDRHTRESQHQGDYEVEGISPRDPSADDKVGGWQPKGNPKNQSYPTEDERIFYQMRCFQKDYPEIFQGPIGWKWLQDPSSGKSG